MRSVYLRPKWLLALLLALGVASLFAWLGQWQLDSAIRSAQHAAEPPLGPTTLGEAATPQQGLLDVSIGRGVSFEGVFDPRDTDIVTQRLQGEEVGYWVIGHVYVTNDGVRAYEGEPLAEHAPGLAVAIGWAPTLDEAIDAADRIRSTTPDATAATPIALEGRLEYGQTPVPPSRDDDPHALNEMAPSFLVNRWAEPGPLTYGSYVILDLPDDARAGLEAIETRAADAGGGLNMLNVFYAVEWAIFAAFTLYVWWRLANAQAERERAAQLAALNPDADAAREIRLEQLRRLREQRDGPPPGAS